MPRQTTPVSFAFPRQASRPQGKPISVFTPTFHLRTMKETDAGETFIGWLASPEILRGLNIPPRKWSVESLRAFISSFDCVNRHLLGIEDRETGRLVGFYVIDINPTHRTSQLTAAVGDPEFVGRNVLREASPILVRHLFDKRDVEKVSARIVASNRRVLFNFMIPDVFQFEARLRQEVRTADGRREDILVFSALKNP
jgi:RimJ/RimL family protein N-acetyltransferase